MYDPSAITTLDTAAGQVKVRPPRGSDRLLASQLAQDAANLAPIFESLLCVVEINGQSQPRPGTRLKIDALADRLGLQAMDQVVGWYQDTIYPEIKEARAELGLGATLDEIGALAVEKRQAKTKNSHETQASGPSLVSLPKVSLGPSSKT